MSITADVVSFRIDGRRRDAGCVLYIRRNVGGRADPGSKGMFDRSGQRLTLSNTCDRTAISLKRRIVDCGRALHDVFRINRAVGQFGLDQTVQQLWSPRWIKAAMMRLNMPGNGNGRMRAPLPQPRDTTSKSWRPPWLQSISRKSRDVPEQNSENVQDIFASSLNSIALLLLPSAFGSIRGVHGHGVSSCVTAADCGEAAGVMHHQGDGLLRLSRYASSFA